MADIRHYRANTVVNTLRRIRYYADVLLCKAFSFQYKFHLGLGKTILVILFVRILTKKFDLRALVFGFSTMMKRLESYCIDSFQSLTLSNHVIILWQVAAVTGNMDR